MRLDPSSPSRPRRNREQREDLAKASWVTRNEVRQVFCYLFSVWLARKCWSTPWRITRNYERSPMPVRCAPCQSDLDAPTPLSRRSTLWSLAQFDLFLHVQVCYLNDPLVDRTCPAEQPMPPNKYSSEMFRQRSFDEGHLPLSLSPKCKRRLFKKDEFTARTVGKFASAMVFVGWTIVILNIALNWGSSKQGNAFRASVGWNFVANIFLNRTSSRPVSPYWSCTLVFDCHRWRCLDKSRYFHRLDSQRSSVSDGSDSLEILFHSNPTVN